jgi:hypothetical protein
VKRIPRQAVLVPLCWVLLACWEILDRAFTIMGTGLGVPPVDGLSSLVALSKALSWTLITYGFLSLARRFPLSPRRNGTIAVHAVSLLVVPVFSVVIGYGILNAVLLDSFSPLERVGGELRESIRLSWHEAVVRYVGLGFVVLLADLARQAHERELRTVALAKEVTEARLRALRMQLHPHFLFNTLNTLLPLISRDQAMAERTLEKLSDLVRFALRAGETPLQPLSREVDILSRYLEIETVRFRDRLKVTWNVAPEVLAAEVPALVLQPLVENAIAIGLGAAGAWRHRGLRPAARRPAFVLTVTDDGPGLEEKSGLPGVGLENTRRRLEQHYGAAARFSLSAGAGGGAVAEIRLPFRTADAPLAAAA